MLRPLYKLLKKEHDVIITARDFDATYSLLDAWGVPYLKVGAHGGAELSDKLHSYIDRLNELLRIIEKEKPDFLFCITSPEAIRIAYGLGLPHIMFYDEPRSVGCSTLTLPMVEHVIVPKPIPIEWYLKYGIPKDNIIQFNGIDEVGWLNQKEFHPNLEYLSELNLTERKYIVFRTIATQSYAHLVGRMKPHETLLTEIIPKLKSHLEKNIPDMKYLVIPRYKEQYEHISEVFSEEINQGSIVLRKNVSHLADIMYFSALVISGGGTMVRESALLGVPSIEFIESDTYPQEQFLMDNGFPLVHVKTPDEVVDQAIKFLNAERNDTWNKIERLDNPIMMGYYLFKKKTQSRRFANKN
jgi:uncharacterized protein